MPLLQSDMAAQHDSMCANVVLTRTDTAVIPTPLRNRKARR